jgi:CRP-like cAMP-binding protein
MSRFLAETAFEGKGMASGAKMIYWLLRGILSMNELASCLLRYFPVSDEIACILEENSLVRRYPKGTILLRQGEPARESYFVLWGCIRSYALKDGEERTLDFYIKEDPVMPIGYGKDEPAAHSLECSEDTIAVVSTQDLEERMLRDFPQLKNLCLAMSQIMAAKLQEQYSRYRTTSPEEGYRYLAENRPELLKRIPQYQIASYLGIQPESLSRIRRRLLGQGKKRPAQNRS